MPNTYDYVPALQNLPIRTEGEVLEKLVNMAQYHLTGELNEQEEEVRPTRDDFL